MDLFIRGAHIITGKKEGIYAGIGNIGIDKGLITYIGRDDMNAARVIDAAGMIAMPGLFNAHTHSSMVLMRNITADKCLEDWLTGSIFPVEDKLTAEYIREASMLAAIEMIISLLIFWLSRALNFLFSDSLSKVSSMINEFE